MCTGLFVPCPMTMQPSLLHCRVLCDCCGSMDQRPRFALPAPCAAPILSPPSPTGTAAGSQGTAFMSRVAEHIRELLRRKVMQPRFARLRVVVSDCYEPAEASTRSCALCARCAAGPSTTPTCATPSTARRVQRGACVGVWVGGAGGKGEGLMMGPKRTRTPIQSTWPRAGPHRPLAVACSVEAWGRHTTGP